MTDVFVSIQPIDGQPRVCLRYNSDDGLEHRFYMNGDQAPLMVKTIIGEIVHLKDEYIVKDAEQTL